MTIYDFPGACSLASPIVLARLAERIHADARVPAAIYEEEMQGRR